MLKNSPVIAICPPPVPSPGPGNSVRGLDLDLLLFVTSAGLLAANNTGWGKVKGPSKQASLWCRLQIFLSCPSFYRRGEGNPPTSIWQRVDRGAAAIFCFHIFLLPLSSAGCGGNVWRVLFAPLLFSLLSRHCTATVLLLLHCVCYKHPLCRSGKALKAVPINARQAIDEGPPSC